MASALRRSVCNVTKRTVSNVGHAKAPVASRPLQRVCINASESSRTVHKTAFAESARPSSRVLSSWRASDNHNSMASRANTNNNDEKRGKSGRDWSGAALLGITALAAITGSGDFEEDRKSVRKFWTEMELKRGMKEWQEMTTGERADLQKADPEFVKAFVNQIQVHMQQKLAASLLEQVDDKLKADLEKGITNETRDPKSAMCAESPNFMEGCEVCDQFGCAGACRYFFQAMMQAEAKFVTAIEKYEDRLDQLDDEESQELLVLRARRNVAQQFWITCTTGHLRQYFKPEELALIEHPFLRGAHRLLVARILPDAHKDPDYVEFFAGNSNLPTDSPLYGVPLVQLLERVENMYNKAKAAGWTAEHAIYGDLGDQQEQEEMPALDQFVAYDDEE